MILLTSVALSLLNTPYKWAGKSPMEGLDCSGLVQILLKSAGEDLPGDQRAQDYFNWFSESGRGEYGALKCGALVFFGKSASQITHVGMLLDQYRFIEAGGGDSTTLTVSDAIAKRAFVRISVLSSRKDVVSIIRPRYRSVGCI